MFLADLFDNPEPGIQQYESKAQHVPQLKPAATPVVFLDFRYSLIGKGAKCYHLVSNQHNH
ncbi:MAG: hypothetical protein ACI87E_000193 [Mariniblastus sp.]|jgi:hypothetical protein